MREHDRPLCAAGSAQRRLGLLDPSAAAFEDRLAGLARGAVDFGLEPEHVHLARALVDLRPGLDDGPRLAAVVLVVATFVGQQQGSTRIPLPGGPAADAFWGALLAGLPPGDLAPAEILAAIDDLLASGALGPLLGDGPAAFAPLVRVVGADGAAWLTHQNVLARERRAGAAVRRLLVTEHASFAPADLRRALREVLDDAPTGADGAPLRPSAHQALAALTPFCGGPRGGPSGLSVITGPPGAGKTSGALATLLRLAARLGVGPIALAAPSARAAQRMTESVGGALRALPGLADRPADDSDRRLVDARLEAVTLHRLLGYSARRGRFFLGPERRLPARLVVVDEASMVDVALADALTGALRDDALLVLLGDGDQLAPVGCGAFFTEVVSPRPTTNVPSRALVVEVLGGAADLPADDPPPADLRGRVTRTLPSSFRTAATGEAGRRILAAADAIRRGDAAALLDGPAPLLARRARPDELELEGVEGLLTDGEPLPGDALAGFLARWSAAAQPDDAVRARVGLTERGLVAPPDADRVREALARQRRHQLLCCTHVEPGTGVQAVNAALHALHLASLGLPSTHGLVAGSPVMMTSNDYHLGIFNGDVGVVLLAAGPGEAPAPRAVFPRGGDLAAFALPALRDRLVLAHAVTVHKAQGSEHERVALLLPARPLPLLERRLLYTAATRARRGAVVVGAQDVLRAGVEAARRRWVGLDGGATRRPG
ncbi:MAG: AAA family ATPase [Planctomycetes bacterium]|nr:AAA family ATPase [Planctomycetota bacterium]